MTDRSPELSNARTDLPLTGEEPVIKGVYSRIVVDRRSAYLAGNMKALLEMMTDEQHQSFRRWNTVVALRLAESVLPLARLPRPDAPQPRTMITAIKAWLANPTEDNAAAIRSARLNPGLIDFPAMAAESAGNTVTATSMMFAMIAAASAARSVGYIRYGDDRRANKYGRALRRAQLRAAYTILQRGERL